MAASEILEYTYIEFQKLWELMVENTHHTFSLTAHKCTHDQAVNHASFLSTPLFEAPNALGGYETAIGVSNNNDFLFLVLNEVFELMADNLGVFEVRGNRRPSASAGQRRSGGRIAMRG